MRDIYLDNSATTPICEEAKKKMLEAMECFGNPSSLHKKGFESSKLINEARTKVLNSLFVRGGKAENLVMQRFNAQSWRSGEMPAMAFACPMVMIPSLRASCTSDGSVKRRM